MLELCSKIFTIINQPFHITLGRVRLLQLTFGDISTFVCLELFINFKGLAYFPRQDSGKTVMYETEVQRGKVCLRYIHHSKEGKLIIFNFH